MYRADNKEIVIALDSKTGKTVWEYKYDSSPSEVHVHQFGDGPRSTPLIVGDTLYTIGVSAKMNALDKKDGMRLWSHELWKDLGGNVLNHGYSSSPMVYKNMIITLVGAKDSSIVAFNKDDGKIVWKAHSFENSYSTPKVINVDGQDQLVTLMAKEIVSVDPNSGNLFWQYPIGDQLQENVCVPEWDNETKTLFFSTREAGAHGLKLSRDGDKAKFEELWSTRKMLLYYVNTVKVGNFIYGSTGDRPPHFVAALNIKYGTLAWRERGLGKTTCVYGDGKFIILNDDGNLALASATPEGFKVLSKAPVLKNPAWTVPTLVGKNLYLRDKTQIVALDLG